MICACLGPLKPLLLSLVSKKGEGEQGKSWGSGSGSGSGGSWERTERGKGGWGSEWEMSVREEEMGERGGEGRRELESEMERTREEEVDEITPVGADSRSNMTRSWYSDSIALEERETRKQGFV